MHRRFPGRLQEKSHLLNLRKISRMIGNILQRPCFSGMNRTFCNFQKKTDFMFSCSPFPMFRLILTVCMTGIPLNFSMSAVELTENELQARLQEKRGKLSEMVERIESTMTVGDATYLASLIDADQVLEQATSGFQGKETPMLRDVFCDGTRRAWIDNNPANDYAGTSFRFLRTRTFQHRGGLLFRSESELGSLNYYLFVMSDAKEGLRVRDIFTVGLNEFTSQALGRTFRYLLASFSPDAGNENPLGKSYVDNIETIAELNRAMRQGKYSQVITLWKSLPGEVARERSVLMLRVDAAERISPEARMAAMADWTAAFPDEMDLPLKVADYFMAKNRWGDAERILRRIMDAVGGDSRMLFQIGQIAHKRRTHATPDLTGQAAADHALPASAREKAASLENP